MQTKLNDGSINYKYFYAYNFYTYIGNYNYLSVNSLKNVLGLKSIYNNKDFQSKKVTSQLKNAINELNDTRIELSQNVDRVKIEFSRYYTEFQNSIHLFKRHVVCTGIFYLAVECCKQILNLPFALAMGLGLCFYLALTKITELFLKDPNKVITRTTNSEIEIEDKTQMQIDEMNAVTRHIWTKEKLLMEKQSLAIFSLSDNIASVNGNLATLGTTDSTVKLTQNQNPKNALGDLKNYYLHDSQKEIITLQVQAVNDLAFEIKELDSSIFIKDQNLLELGIESELFNKRFFEHKVLCAGILYLALECCKQTLGLSFQLAVVFFLYLGFDKIIELLFLKNLNLK